jgi:hypothetical protein
MIKSQQDIKNANKAKADKVPKSMENKAKDAPVAMDNSQPIVPLIKRVENIEEYLGKVDVAFEKIVTELNNLKSLMKIIQTMDSEISKITGDIIRISKLEEERYIELATGVNHLNDKITTLDEYIPVFIDKRLDEYFEAISTDIETDETNQDEETPKE